MNSGRIISNVLLLVFLASQVTLAQVTTGTILGTVSDSTGAVIPSATITLRNVDTGISRTSSTDAAGRYRMPQLGLGGYEVSAEAAGFQTGVRTGITLTVGREAVVDFTLQVGGVAERITVTGEAPLLETTNATVSTLMDEATMRDLPLNGRSFGELAGLQPGVVSNLPIGSEADAVYNGGGGNTRRSISGTRPQHSMYLLDGIEISTPSEGMPVNGVTGQQLGVEAIREFSLLQNNYGAQYGRASGGVVNAVTQSGTNSFHGSVFEFFRNSALDARDFFLLPIQEKAPLRRNQLGGALGGPIQKDHTFFFLNYEAVRQSGGQAFVGTVFTPETLLGRITDATGKVTRIVTVNADIKGAFFPLIPGLPTLLPNGTYNYRSDGLADRYSTPGYIQDENYGTTRIDRQFSAADSLFGRLTIDRSARTDFREALYPEGFKGIQVGGYIVAAISETHVFSPTVINNVRVGYTRRNDTITTNYTLDGEFFPQGHPKLDPRLSPITGVPVGVWSPPGSIYGSYGPGIAGPAHFVDNAFTYDDSVLINHGRHAIDIGVDVKRYQGNEANEPFRYGDFGWRGTVNFLQNQPDTTKQYIGSDPSVQIADLYRGWRQTYGAWYVQDDLKLLSNLTLNLGVRWEVISSPREVNGKYGRLVDIFKDAGLTPLKKGDPYFEIHDAMKGLSPRFGFAWTPFASQKTVFRGGFGIFKEMPLIYIYQLALDAPGYAKQYRVNNPDLKWPYPFKNLASIPAGAGDLVRPPADMKMPYNMQWTLSMEHQLRETLVVKFNYLGLKGNNQIAIGNEAQPFTKIDANGRQYTPVPAVFPNPNYIGFRTLAPIASLWYNAGQFAVEKRFSQGLRASVSHTWARNIDSGGGAGVKCSESLSGTTYYLQNTYDRAAEKGLSPLHVKHNFIANLTYELPFGSGRQWGSEWTGITDAIFGGWTISSAITSRTGLPTNVTTLSRWTGCPTDCDYRPDLAAGGNNNPILENWTPEKYFDYTNFVLQKQNYFGTSGRNTLITPGLTNLNFSVAKDSKLGETADLEFRAEFFNVLNHPNFGRPSSSVFNTSAGDYSPSAGRITDTSTKMRQIQFGLKLTF